MSIDVVKPETKKKRKEEEKRHAKITTCSNILKVQGLGKNIQL